MHRILKRALSCVLVLASMVVSASAEVKIVSWNVREAFTPDVVNNRRSHFKAFADEVKPDILLVQEVNSLAVVEAIRDVMGLDGYFVYCSNFEQSDSPNHSTFEVGIISRYEPYQVIEYDPTPDNDPNSETDPSESPMPKLTKLGLEDVGTSRGYLWAHFPQFRLTLFNVHLKSSGGAGGAGDRSNAAKREIVAAAVADGVNEDLAFFPNHAHAVLGDFNIGHSDAGKNGTRIDDDDEDGYDDTHAIFGAGLVAGLSMRNLMLSITEPTYPGFPGSPIDNIYVTSPRAGGFGAAQLVRNTHDSDHRAVATVFTPLPAPAGPVFAAADGGSAALKDFPNLRARASRGQIEQFLIPASTARIPSAEGASPAGGPKPAREPKPAGAPQPAANVPAPAGEVHAGQKYFGRLFDPPSPLAPHVAQVAAVNKPGELPPDITRATSTSPSELPPLQVRVLVGPGTTIPEALNRVVTKAGASKRTASAVGRKLILNYADLKTVRAAGDFDEVKSIEIERPNRVRPNPKNLVGEMFGGPLRTFNRDARITHSVSDFLGTYAATTDRGATVLSAVFDEGAVRKSHVEFAQERVTVVSTAPLSRHSTHVAGTICAKGVRGQAIGMAEKGKVLSYDWNDDLTNLDAAAAAAEPIRISNHSYGPAAGWDQERDGIWYWWGDVTLSETEDAKFGKYGQDNLHLDALLSGRPYLVTFVAAGNDRNDGPVTPGRAHYALGRNPSTGDLEWQFSTKARNPDGFDNGGLDTIGGLGLSKNAVCIGAIRDVTSADTPIVTTDFSAWGPTDDFRVKPDLVANGAQLLSTSSTGDQAYVEESGTSMACPTAAGIGALLVENYHKTKGQWPNSDTVKAILIHSAQEAGAPGPDPIYGWGSIDALEAGALIAGAPNISIIAGEVDSTNERVYRFRKTGDNNPVRATLVWIDPPPPAPNHGGLDDSTAVLQNDLDLTVTSPATPTIYPYSLNRANVSGPALQNAANRVDNVEVVDAPAAAGNWQVKVRAHELKSGSSQKFALIVTGLSATQ